MATVGAAGTALAERAAADDRERKAEGDAAWTAWIRRKEGELRKRRAERATEHTKQKDDGRTQAQRDAAFNEWLLQKRKLDAARRQTEKAALQSLKIRLLAIESAKKPNLRPRSANPRSSEAKLPLPQRPGTASGNRLTESKVDQIQQASGHTATHVVRHSCTGPKLHAGKPTFQERKWAAKAKKMVKESPLAK